VQNAKRGSDTRPENGGSRAKLPLETRTPGPKDIMREVSQEGESAAHGGCGCSSLRVPEWIFTINSHSVEILIARCVGEMVRDPNPMSFFFLFSFFLFSFSHAFIVFRYKKLRAGLAMERTKLINQNKTTKKTNLVILRRD